mgnify:CR=1 FL=1
MTKTVTSRFVLKGDNRLNKSFSKARQQLTALGRQAGIAGAVAIAATAAIVRAQAKQIDSLAKTADALGITTENLQTLRTMAELTGVETEKFDKSLRKMQKTIGEVARRGGDMALAITDMGLSVADVMALPADKQFEVVAEALTSVENASVRASIANDLFGRDAQKLLKLTDQVAREGLAPMRDELEAIGVLISRTEAAGVERMNDSMKLAGDATSALAQRFTIELAPAIAAIAEGFLDAAKESGGFKEETKTAADSVISTFGFVADVVDSIGREFRIVSNVGIIAFESLKFAVVDLADSIINGPNRAIDAMLGQLDRLPGVDIDFRLGRAIPQLQADVNQSAAIIKAAREEINAILLEPLPSGELQARLAKVRADLQNAAPSEGGGGVSILPAEEEQRIAKVQGLLDGLLQQAREFGLDDRDKALLKFIDLGATEEQITAVRQVADELRILEETQTRIEDREKMRVDLQREYNSLVEATRTPLEQHSAAIARIGEMYEAGVIPSAAEYAEVVRRTNERFVESQEKVSELSEFTIQAARSMESAFADFLFDPFDQGLKGMLKSFANTIRQMVAQAAAAAILKSIFGGFAGSSNSGLASIGKFFGGARAAGGPIDSNRSFLVGERGPELIVPRGPGTVVPNNKLGGNSVVVNIDARETDNPARLLSLVPLIQSQVEQGISLKMRRGFL